MYLNYNGKIIENRIKFDINAKHNARLFFKCYVIFFSI